MSPSASEPPRTRRVVVVGGGISGLTAAHALRSLPSLPDGHPAYAATVLEAAPEVGGKLRRHEVGGVGVDVGAEAILNRRPEGVELAREVGLGPVIVYPATITAHLWSRGSLHPMPRTVLGVPTDVEALAGSGVLSAAGLERLRQEPDQPPTDLVGRDLSVAALVGQRLGSEVVDRLVEPLLGGVYAGHATELSARAAAPQVVALLDSDASLLRAAARRQTATTPPEVPVFAGIEGGVARLPETLADSDRFTVETGATVRALRRTSVGWELTVGTAREPRLVTADAVVLATPAAPTARLLTEVAPDAARLLAVLEYASMAIVTMAFRAADLPPVSGSGFLVPPVDGRTIKAATFSFAKWGWVRSAGTGPDDEMLVLRCSIGRHREEAVLQVPDEELVAVALADLADAIGLRARPVEAHVQRWGGALPQYAVGHLDLVASARAAVARVPGLVVCGAAYDGLGIPACIASARRAVADLDDRPASSSSRRS